MKKLLVLMLTASMALGLAACGSSGDQGSQNASSAESEGTDGDAAYTVGVCQLVQHGSLDAATEGFKAALEEEFGDQVEVDVQNAQNDSNTCTTIINSFVSNDVDLIMANATASLQAAAAGTDTIPILGTSVTEYGVALQLDNFDGTVGGNISGTSDLAPLDQLADMFQELLPDAETVGLLYCSAEPNSQYQVDTMKEYLEELGYTCEYYAFSDSNDLSSVTTGASQECDAIYVPTDNTVASNAGIINNICLPAGVPVIASEESTCSQAAIATLCIDYYDLGYTTGQMAVRILKGEEDISEMPIEYAPQTTKKYNPSICQELGIDIPEGYEAIEG